ncbi:MAG: CxxC-x17-CxxC domain-containing protein [Nanoarchaeota archaeon]
MGFNNFRDSGSSNSFQQEKHKAVCSKCKKDCEVPFKPTEGKPVYCRECFATMPKKPRF